MPKKVLAHPNERIDIPDYVRGSNDYTAEMQAFLVEVGLLDDRSRVLEGFRIELADQTASPGQLTVYNGTATDRSGQLIRNEDQANTSKSVTLTGASTTFYLEIEFTETNSDTDARGFWDPTYDQPSPIPDGAEFDVSVATRESPDWRIVTPVSTTGFEKDTNPDSTRIPLAILATDGSNEITGAVNTGLSSVQPSTKLEQSYGSGVSEIRVIDSIPYQISDVITVGFGGATPDAGLTITGVDYDNHLITFAPATGNAHTAGAIVRRTSGTGRFVEQRTEGVPTAGSHPDMKRGYFQGDEVRGGAFALSKETFGERDDLDLRTLKDKIDLIDALLRELKFGAFDPTDTSSAPPTSFPTAPRYVHAAGSVAGGRLPTVSVGDGGVSYGDYNGPDESPFTAAIAHLTTLGGGVLLVKHGTYNFANTVTVTVPITIIGEGKEITEIQSDVAAGPAFRFALSAADEQNKVIMQDMKFTVNTGQESVIELETVTFAPAHCEFVGACITLTGSVGVASRITAYGCLFNPAGSADAAITGTSAFYAETLLNSTFDTCWFVDGSGTFPCVYCDLNNVTFLNCSLQGDRILNSTATSQGWSDVAFYSCQVATDDLLVLAQGAVDRLTFDNCSFTVTGGDANNGLMDFTSAVTNITIRNSLFNTTWSGTGAGTQGRILEFNNTVDNLRVENCDFVSNTGQVVDHISFEGSFARENIQIVGNRFTNGYRTIRHAGAGTTYNFTVMDNYIDGGLQAIEQHGLLVEDGVFFGKFLHNTVRQLDGAQLKRGVTCLSPSAGGVNITIAGNRFELGATTPVASTSAGVFLDASSATEIEAIVADNKFSTLSGVSNIYGVYVDAGGSGVSCSVSVRGNQFTSGMITTGAASSHAVAIFVRDANEALVLNNKVEEIQVASADCAGVRIANVSSALVSGNEINTPIVTGSPANFKCAIQLEGTLTNVRCVNNVVRDTENSTNSTIGIQLFNGNAQSNVSIDGNQVFMGADLAAGISVYGTNSLTNLSVSGNRVVGIERADAVGISILPPNNAQGIQCNNNFVTETTFDTGHIGIDILATDGVEALSVQCNNNVVQGDLTGSGTRNAITSGFGIHLEECIIVQCNGNLVHWCDAAIDGISIEIEGCEHGSVMSNVIRPRNPAGSLADLRLNGGTGFIVGGNIIGSTSQGAGQFTNLAADVLIGTANTSTEFTNKTS